jgi:hypothetical protein
VPPGQAAPTGDAESPENTGVVADAAPVEQGYVPPEGWTPEPGTGIAPDVPVAAADSAASDAAAETAPAAESGSFTPPDDWTPEPGTGIAPDAGSASSEAAPADATTEATAEDTSAFVPPEGWTPEEGSGIAPQSATAGGDNPDGSNADGTAADDDTVGGTGGGTEYIPPADWQPEPGTGIAPIAAAEGVQTSGVLLVTRTADAAELTEATFEVVAPTSELAQEARARLEELQAKAALGLFADIDPDGYVSSVAPRPVHGVCSATADGVVCVPLAALQDD